MASHDGISPVGQTAPETLPRTEWASQTYPDQREIRIDLRRLALTYGIELDEAMITGKIHEDDRCGGLPGDTLTLVGRRIP
jgi:hypothetical protein